MEKEAPEIRLADDAASALETARAVQGALGRSASKHRFEYGWCRTDHKSGKEIRRDFRKDDYVFDEPYASRVAAMLDTLGLPQPGKGQVFRGTHHDLLFLDSHGVVLRIGPTEVEDLINPAILQPLGWLQDDKTKIHLGVDDRPLTVAVYPGVEIFDHYVRQRGAPELEGRLRDVLRDTGQQADDMEGEGNTGVIRVKADDGRKHAVRLLIDTDNDYNGTRLGESSQRKRAIDRLLVLMRASGFGMDAVVGATLGSLFDSVAMPWHYAQAAHQPLRSLFWNAFQTPKIDDAQPDAQRRDAFWHACGVAAHKPVRLPSTLWSALKNADGSTTLTCREVMMDVRLYKPWTGYKSDRPGMEGWHPEDMIRIVKHALAKAGHLVRDVVGMVRDMLAPQGGMREAWHDGASQDARRPSAPRPPSPS